MPPIDQLSFYIGLGVGAFVVLFAFNAWLIVQLASNTGHDMPMAFRSHREDLNNG